MSSSDEDSMVGKPCDTTPPFFPKSKPLIPIYERENSLSVNTNSFNNTSFNFNQNDMRPPDAYKKRGRKPKISRKGMGGRPRLSLEEKEKRGKSSDSDSIGRDKEE